MFKEIISIIFFIFDLLNDISIRKQRKISSVISTKSLKSIRSTYMSNMRILLDEKSHKSLHQRPTPSRKLSHR